MPMAALEEIRSLYEGYWDEVARLRAQGKAADGLLGLGGGPASDACQDRFAAAVQETFERLAGLELPAGELQAVLEYVYRIPLEYRKDRVIFWMLLAVQGATLPLVAQLPAAQAALSPPGGRPPPGYQCPPRCAGTLWARAGAPGPQGAPGDPPAHTRIWAG